MTGLLISAVHLVLTLVTALSPPVALTFDDGPGPATSDILDTLTDHGALATFFVVGDRLPGREHLVEDLVDAGMSVQWHSVTHPELTRLTDSDISDQMVLPASLADAGAHPSCIRPPYGAIDDRVRTAADEAGLEVVLWDVDPRDWAATSTNQIVEAVMSEVQPGSVVLLHDRPLTARALPELLEALSDRGFRTVSLCD